MMLEDRFRQLVDALCDTSSESATQQQQRAAAHTQLVQAMEAGATLLGAPEALALLMRSLPPSPADGAPPQPHLSRACAAARRVAVAVRCSESAVVGCGGAVCVLLHMHPPSHTYTDTQPPTDAHRVERRGGAHAYRRRRRRRHARRRRRW